VVAWHRCEVNVYDEAKKRILQSDVAASEEVTTAMTKWSGTCDFMRDLANDTLTTLKSLYRHKELQRTKQGNYTLKCHVSFTTALQVTKDMIKDRTPRTSRTGKRKDPPQHYRFRQIICKSSAKSRGAKYGSRQQVDAEASSTCENSTHSDMGSTATHKPFSL